MKRAVAKEGPGEVGGEGGNGCADRAAVQSDYSGFSAGVKEGLVLWTGNYVATIAAHKSEIGWGGGERWERVCGGG